MEKEVMFAAINAKYEELKSALEGDDLEKISVKIPDASYRS